VNVNPKAAEKGYDSSMTVRWLAGLVFAAAMSAQPALAQGKLATREFHAELSAEEETRFVESPAKGVADLVVDLNTLEVRWKITFRDLTSRPTGITLHGPAQPGANGVVFLDLAPRSKTSPLEGTAQLNDAQVQFMLNRWSYINITTEKFPKGEIRGQIQTMRPKPEL
jgi:hypothetical protein